MQKVNISGSRIQPLMTITTLSRPLAQGRTHGTWVVRGRGWHERSNALISIHLVNHTFTKELDGFLPSGKQNPSIIIVLLSHHYFRRQVCYYPVEWSPYELRENKSKA